MIDFNTPPEFVNEIGVKWWADSHTTAYAQKPDFKDITLPDVSVWVTEEANGLRSLVIVKGGEVVYSNPRLEAVGAQIDWMKLQKAFDRRDGKNF